MVISVFMKPELVTNLLIVEEPIAAEYFAKGPHFFVSDFGIKFLESCEELFFCYYPNLVVIECFEFTHDCSPFITKFSAYTSKGFDSMNRLN
jgi:hypothetical protein